MYQTQQELFRLLKQQLLATQVKSLTFLLIGITAIITPPLIAKDTESYRDRIINGLSFALGLFSFGYCLTLVKSLRMLEGKNKMIEELEKDLFIEEEIRVFSQLKTHQLNPVIDVTPIPTSPTSALEVEVPKPPTTVNFPTSTSTSTSTSASNEQELDKVIEAIQKGQTDTDIIENILGYKGRKFAKGKDILDAYKALLNG